MSHNNADLQDVQFFLSVKYLWFSQEEKKTSKSCWLGFCIFSLNNRKKLVTLRCIAKQTRIWIARGEIWMNGKMTLLYCIVVNCAKNMQPLPVIFFCVNNDSQFQLKHYFPSFFFCFSGELSFLIFLYFNMLFTDR